MRPAHKRPVYTFLFIPYIDCKNSIFAPFQQQKAMPQSNKRAV